MMECALAETLHQIAVVQSSVPFELPYWGMDQIDAWVAEAMLRSAAEKEGCEWALELGGSS